MKFIVSQVAKPGNKYYPYSHRLEFHSSNYDTELEVNDWLKKNKVSCCVVPYQPVSPWSKTIAVYMNEPDLTAFILKWK